MPIDWDAASRELHLRNGRISHLLRVEEDGSIGTLHLGGPLGRGTYGAGTPPMAGWRNRVGESIPVALPTPGGGDLRGPALTIVGADGASVLSLRYLDHRILPGKPAGDGPLPRVYVESADEAETLEVDLRDEPSGVVATLSYTIHRDLPVIVRSLRVTNGGRAPVTVACAMSASADLPDADWELLQLSGAWARERHVVRSPLVPGRRSIGARAGVSSAQQNPFVALLRPWTTEEAGEALGLSLVYSGSFLAEAEVDQYATTRVRIGIDPDGFAWRLEPGASFEAPEAVIAWSDAGLGGLSAAYHELYRTRLARGAWRDRPRPILLNTWEGTYFDFDEAAIVEIARSARELGVELLVLDDGWFGRRDDDTTSLGDWDVDRRKLPNGVDGLARRVVELGLGFGIWIEPEMVSPASELFRAHPDWAIGVPGRPRTESRNQLVLDLSRPEVLDHLHAAIAGLLRSAPISYVKWDMNRLVTEPYSAALPPDRQGELLHRQVLGVYELYRRLTSEFPAVLFESCASGGARFDPGILAYAPQGWASDDTDAAERLAIQWGTSIVYPTSAIGAHVSAVPNHQTGRVTPLATRAAVAFFGAFGYELDPRRLTDAERREVAGQIEFYRRWRPLLQFGRFLRLRDPASPGGETAWMSLADDGSAALVGWYRVLARPNPGPTRLRLRGLAPDASYRVSTWPDGGADDALARANGRVRRGDDLMRLGLHLDLGPRLPATSGDFGARIFVVERV